MPFQSPAYGLSRELAQILAEKRAIQQQEFVNQITSQREAREAEYQRENLASMKAQREAQAEAARQLAAQRFKEGVGVGDEFTDEQYQKALELGLGHMFQDEAFPAQPNVIQQILSQKGEGEVGPDPTDTMTGPEQPPKRGHFWKGDDAQRTDYERERFLDEILSNPDLRGRLSQMDPITRFMTLRKIDPKGTIASTLFTQQKPETKSLILVDPRGKILTPGVDPNNIPANAVVERLGFPPQPSSANIPNINDFREVVGPDGKGTGNYVTVDRDGNIVPGKLGGGLTPATASTTKPTASARPREIPWGLIKQYSDVRGKYEASGYSSSLPFGWGDRPKDAALNSNAETLAAEIIRRYPMSDESAKNDVMDAWLDPSMRNLPVQEIVASFVAPDGSELSPETVREMTILLKILKGEVAAPEGVN